MSQARQKAVIAVLSGLLLVGVVILGGLLLGVGRPPDARVLFIGNSFTFYHNLYQMTGNIAESADDDLRRVEVEQIALPGYTLHQHAATLSSPTSDLSMALNEEWDVIILQEQSQIPGFGANHPDWQQSAAAMDTLIARGQATGAEVITYMTWGYRSGDDMNPTLYGSYLTMQSELAQGYFAHQDRTYTYVAPVGLAFRTVYNEDSAIFQQLYDTDGRHPSLAGSYLAAAVIAASFTDERVAEADYVPSTLDPQRAAYLRQVADRTVYGD